MKTLIPFRAARVNPWRDLEAIERRFNRLLEGSFPSFVPEEPIGWMPAMDLDELETEYLLTAELPGLKEEDVEIAVEDDVLTFKGEKKEEREDKDARRHVFERSYGMFERSFTLPRTVEVEKIKAEFKDGVLQVHLPKKEEAKGRKILIAKK